MKTQEQLRVEYENLLEAEDFGSARKVLDLLEPVSDGEWLRAFRDAPEVDEPVPEFVRERSRGLDAVLAKRTRQAG